jgi:tetratricopeptide (TPR) repeat protein
VPATALTLRRKLLYAAILSGAAIVFSLAALELGLRIAGYGYSAKFFRRAKTADGQTIWRENRWATAPWFSPELVRRPQPFRLPKNKPPGAYRIFVLGSSAAMGDPEPSFSLGRMLEVMLHAAYPNQHFEFVNAAVTAINSHVTRQIAADCARLEPDLFIVYEGHNEVIGPFGPAGVFAPFFHSETAIQLAGALKRTRTGQLIGATNRKLRHQENPRSEWGGMEMFLRQQLTNTDERLEDVRQHFQANLLAIGKSAAKAGAHTLFCTVLTNQRDFAPFMSQHRPGLSDEARQQWDERFAAAQEAERAGNLAAAESAYRAALAIDDHHAELVFRLARLLMRAGRDAEAQPIFQWALDLDTLRFRTDSTLNAIIRNLDLSSLPNAEVVDLATTISAQSPHGVVGDEELYEHVHLTLRGAYDVARSLFDRISEDLRRRQFTIGATPQVIDYSAARLRLAFTAYEQAMIATQLTNRFRSPPFTGQADHAVRLELWQRRTAAANALLERADAASALATIYREAISLSPGDWILQRNAGAMFVARHAPQDGLAYLQRAAAWIDDDVDTLVPLGWAERALGHNVEADAAFAKARALEPRYPNLPKPAR